MLFAGLGLVRIVRTVTSGLKMLPSDCGLAQYFKTTVTVFHYTDLQAGKQHIFFTWPVRLRAQFPWKTIREKVSYEGRTHRSDRAGKTRTALLEMRTALLETPTAKSMPVDNKNNFNAGKFCSLQNESWKWTFGQRLRAVFARSRSQLFTIRTSQPANNIYFSYDPYVPAGKP